VKGNARELKRATVTLLANWRVSPEVSNTVGGEVLRKGSVEWKRTSASVSGSAPAVTFRVKGNANGVAEEHVWRVSRHVDTDGVTPTNSNSFLKLEGPLATADTSASSHAEKPQHATRTIVASGMLNLICHLRPKPESNPHTRSYPSLSPKP
jgi:hypothetical protein